MDTNLALLIIGVVMTLFGVGFNVNPKAVNKVIMGELAEEAVNPAAALRIMTGAFSLAIGIISFCCRDLPYEQASTLLSGLAIGFVVLIAGIFSIKIRGFSDDIPIPPIVVFIILTIIAIYAS